MAKFTPLVQASRSLWGLFRKRPALLGPVRFYMVSPVLSQNISSRKASNITTVFSKDGVPPIGPYSQAVKANGLVWVSGQIPANNKSELIVGTMAEKTHKMCQNARSVLEAAGSSLDKVVKVNIFFANLDDYKDVNEVYAEYFLHNPARSSIEAKRLPAGASLEMELVALE